MIHAVIFKCACYYSKADRVCHPTKLGGHSILQPEKFAAALQLRWLWLEWVDESKSWIRHWNPCNENGRALFAAAICATVENGEKPKFWTSPEVDGICPKNVTPKIYKKSKKMYGSKGD
jgi:hypothetical protein